MIEIRAIQQSEAPTFLRLLCDVFELDYDRAEGIFFNEPMFDLRRKWALFDKGTMVSILTTVPLEFGWGNAMGIAGVATKASRQRQGLGEQLIKSVLAHAESQGESTAWLFAKEQGLYTRCGFQVVDEVVRFPLRGQSDDSLKDMLAFDQIRRIYDSWSQQDAARLRRDDRRWNYWKWNLRVCTAFGDGYICHEGKQVREIVIGQRPGFWRFPSDAEWMGLRSMAEHVGLPISDPITELFLMGRNAPGKPQMFMTDQF